QPLTLLHMPHLALSVLASFSLGSLITIPFLLLAALGAAIIVKAVVVAAAVTKSVISLAVVTTSITSLSSTGSGSSSCILKTLSACSRVGKGFFRVDTPLFEGMLVLQQAAEDVANVGAADVDDVIAEDAAKPTPLSHTPTPPPPPP
nr:hypothetical protein [Tanacetum cinerariifolium]